MFRYFENLIDPFVAYKESNAPPTKLWPFMLDYSRPFRPRVCLGHAAIHCCGGG